MCPRFLRVLGCFLLLADPAAAGAAAPDANALQTFPFERRIVNIELERVDLQRTPNPFGRGVETTPSGKHGHDGSEVWYGAIDLTTGGSRPQSGSSLTWFGAEYRDGAAQRVWLDRDQDGDFQDDAGVDVYVYSEERQERSFIVDLKAPTQQASAGQKARVILEAPPSKGAPAYRCQIVYGQAGEIVIEGQRHRAFLFDGSADGRYSSEFGDGVFMDLDDDGSVEVEQASPEFGPFGVPFQVGTHVYTIEPLDQAGGGIRVRSVVAHEPDNKLQPGLPAPTFRFVDQGGRLVSLDALRGKYVLLHFWASWCSTCNYQAPQLVDLYENYRTRGLQIVGVSFDTSDSAAAAFRIKHREAWPTSVSGRQFWEDPIGRRYQVRGAGTMYLIDPRGNLDGMYSRVELVEKALRTKLTGEPR